jgi:hypothetical protein
MRTGIAVAAAVALGAAGATVLTGTADAAKVKVPATFTMYANVDANGDLGSNAGAVSAGFVPGSPVYQVTFSKPVGSCAAVAQVGKAGGSDQNTFESTEVDIDTADSFDVQFGTTTADGGSERFHEPFMLTVTCTK